LDILSRRLYYPQNQTEEAMMARDKDDKAVEGKDFTWVDMKDSKGNIVKDGKGNAVKTRKFGKDSAKESSPAPKPQTSTKSAPKPPAGMKSSPRPKARPEKPSIVGPATKAPQVKGSGTGMAGAVGSAVKKGITAMTSGPAAKTPNRADAYKSQTNPDAKRLKKLREDLAAQKRRSSSKGGMTLRERNQP
jgi:hypothetical protein